MILEEKQNKLTLISSQLIKTIKEIDPKLKVLLMIEDGEISIVQSSNPADLTEAIGLLRVTEARLYIKEQEMFKKRNAVNEAIKDFVEKSKINSLKAKGDVN